MASSDGRLSFSAGPSSSPSSVDWDNDTDLDSTDGEIQSQGFPLPLPGQQLPQQSPRQYAHPERYPSLRSDLQDDYNAMRPDPPQHYQLSGEEKQYFDHFWTDFHKKRQQRRAQVRDTYLDTERSADDIMNRRYYHDKPYNARAYEFPRHRQPLVSLIRNGWQTDSRLNVRSGWSSDDPDPTSPTFGQVLSAPRPRRWLLTLITSFIFCFVYWRLHGAEAWEEHRVLSNAVRNRLQSDLGWFGTNMLPEFVGMTHLKTLDSNLVPRPGESRRLIVVGDVHGCLDERKSSLLCYLSTRTCCKRIALV